MSEDSLQTQDKEEGAGHSPLLLSSAKGLCPRCCAQTLFVSPVAFAETCKSCGLDYRQFNVGDGPAAFLTLIVGALVLVLALSLEFSARPPLWVHLLLWPLLTIVCVTASLRVAKGMLLILEYRNKAREGVLMADPASSGQRHPEDQPMAEEEGHA